LNIRLAVLGVQGSYIESLVSKLREQQEGNL
jgi:hypothetical protein